ncbi:LysR family transcriptional regulator [Allorhizobium taibaishanense]|uniref:HTH-type transcriptional regulator TtuA n=1 Tax=Allorhizobium taibaishanense TaxID=887144 RepID=A0A1Q8ZZX3_9HYPH|nr:LysR family transcriptional regulator [Allorhizobium taibaishanense]MBB4007224.1 DNA-binding transcriptional LysR family regulator [Allorhizobium taibaishanense]OLP47768.1 LysR family transcriptional regulator [Allorhizobium taibaishanense]
MDSLRGIDSFIRAVETGSIAAAARQLGITPAAASQNIARLEQEIGTRLLVRTTRRLALTEAGKIYFERVRRVVSDLDAAQAALSVLHERPQGRLRVAVSAAFGRHVIARMLPSFSAAWPDVSVELILNDERLDHIRDEIDISIRFFRPTGAGLVTRRLGSVPIIICASPDYLAEHGVPREPEELKNHSCLLFRTPYDGRLLPWGFIRNGIRFEPELHVSIICNDIDALATMTMAGAGISRLGAFLARDLVASGKVVSLFATGSASSGAEADPEPLDFHICLQDRQAMLPKVRLFIDHIIEEWRKNPVR